MLLILQEEWGPREDQQRLQMGLDLHSILLKQFNINSQKDFHLIGAHMGRDKARMLLELLVGKVTLETKNHKHLLRIYLTHVVRTDSTI
jgi:hypothetical protein